jgi:hypothetical protein
MGHAVMGDMHGVPGMTLARAVAFRFTGREMVA